MKIKATWQGGDDLENDFKLLSKGMQGQALRAALKAAAKPVLDAAKAASPSKRVARALVTTVSGSGAIAVAKIGAKKKSAGNRILHLVEKGARSHPIAIRKKRVLAGRGMVFGVNVSHPGMRGRDFFRRQLADHRQDSSDKFASAMRKIMDSMRLRLLKRQLTAATRRIS